MPLDCILSTPSPLIPLPRKAQEREILLIRAISKFEPASLGGVIKSQGLILRTRSRQSRVIHAVFPITIFHATKSLIRDQFNWVAIYLSLKV